MNAEQILADAISKAKEPGYRQVAPKSGKAVAAAYKDGRLDEMATALLTIGYLVDRIAELSAVAS